MADLSILHVLLHGRPVGKLLDLWGGRTLFEFDEAYAGDGHRPTLGLCLNNGAGGVAGDTQPCRGRLMPFFSNLLPEGELLDWLAAEAGLGPGQEFALLRELGGDLPGAVTVRPDGERSPASPMRFSLAGMRMKFSAVADARSRLAIPAHGQGGDWIVKPPSPRWPALPENEWATMELARRVGIDVPETRLLPLAEIDGLPGAVGGPGERAFAVRRFDRVDGASVHSEDFAQVFGVHPERKYNRGSLANIAQVLSRTPGLEGGRLEFIRRVVFNALIGNGDAHLKDWALVYPDGRTPSLAPAYGLVSTIMYFPGTIMALKVSRSKKFGDFGKSEILHLAERAALPKRAVWNTARETVALFHEAWAGDARSLPIGEEMRSVVDKHLETLPLLREA